jgi:hypothetical protein
MKYLFKKISKNHENSLLKNFLIRSFDDIFFTNSHRPISYQVSIMYTGKSFWKHVYEWVLKSVCTKVHRKFYFILCRLQWCPNETNHISSQRNNENPFRGNTTQFDISAKLWKSNGSVSADPTACTDPWRDSGQEADTSGEIVLRCVFTPRIVENGGYFKKSISHT